MSDADLAACRFAKREWRDRAFEKTAELHEALANNVRCAHRVERGEELLRWVRDETDMSGQMELSAAIDAYLGEI